MNKHNNKIKILEINNVKHPPYHKGCLSIQGIFFCIALFTKTTCFELNVFYVNQPSLVVVSGYNIKHTEHMYIVT